MRVYLAGRMSYGHDSHEQDWRTGGRTHKVSEPADGNWSDFDWEPMGCDGYTVVGPFPILDQHGLSGVARGHSMAEDGEWTGIPRKAGYSTLPTRDDVQQACLRAINRADMVVVWLDRQDAEESHGTMVEVGYARASGKHILIATNFDVENSELWFAAHMADSIVRLHRPSDIHPFLAGLSYEQ